MRIKLLQYFLEEGIIIIIMKKEMIGKYLIATIVCKNKTVKNFTVSFAKKKHGSKSFLNCIVILVA